MRRAAIALLVLALLGTGIAMPDDEIEQRYFELTQDSRGSADSASRMILDDFYGYQMAEVIAASSGSEWMTASSFHEMLYPGLSEEGIETLGDAVIAELEEELEDLNYSARLREAQCDEALVDDAFAAANALSDVEEAVYERKLRRYMAICNSLSPEDQERIRQHNSEHYGIRLPSVLRGGRDIELTLATEFPDRYLAKYRASCADTLANRGRPFRKILSRPGTGCARVSSDGNSAELLSGCWTEISFTQEPEESTPEKSNTDVSSE